VEQVSWEEAQSYLRKLNQKVAGRTEGPYRLPSESEWAHGCRGGARQEAYCGSDHVDSVAWYDGNSGNYGSATQRVGAKQGNGDRLHDMGGNVWERTRDCHEASYAGAPTDGGSAVSAPDCARRVMRGGSWYNCAAWVRSAKRSWGEPTARSHNLGFRVAGTLP